jgi:hypothetical protein
MHVVSFPGSASAQSHFADCTTNTGDSASIILSAEVAPTIDGVPFVEKTEIAVYTASGDCAGAVTWTGSSVAITAWGDDVMTRKKDGYAVGERMTFRIWDPQTATEYGVDNSSSVTITYDKSEDYFRNDGRYSKDAIYSLTSMAVASESAPVLIAAPTTVYPTDGAEDVALSATFEWQSTAGAAEYDVQILRELGADSMRLIIDSTGVKGTTLEIDLDEETQYSWRVRATAGESKSAWTPLSSFHTQNEPTPPKDGEALPSSVQLDQNYPNPFNPDTTIPFELPESVATRLIVFDMLGKEVAVLADEVLEAGTHQVRWNAREVPSGMYVYVLQTPTTRLTRTLVLVK